MILPCGVESSGGRAGHGFLQEAMKRNFYHPELDCLRFVAFLAVFLHNCFPQQNPVSYSRLGSTLAALGASIVQAGGLGIALLFCIGSK